MGSLEVNPLAVKLLNNQLSIHSFTWNEFPTTYPIIIWFSLFMFLKYNKSHISRINTHKNSSDNFVTTYFFFQNGRKCFFFMLVLLRRTSFLGHLLSPIFHHHFYTLHLQVLSSVWVLIRINGRKCYKIVGCPTVRQKRRIF